MVPEILDVPAPGKVADSKKTRNQIVQVPSIPKEKPKRGLSKLFSKLFGKN